ncbi:MAG: MaoC family dehydratase [Dehalococcoidia bacterium]
MSAELRVGQTLPAYQVRAYNGAAQSENKIHDDAVAREYGFAGGLVPGVTVHAYMTQPAIEAFGLAWLERGSMSSRFLKPVYEGELVTVEAAVTSVGDGDVTMSLVAKNPAGVECGVGSATLHGSPGAAVDLRDFPEAPLPAQRPVAAEGVFAGLDILGSLREPAESGRWEKYLAETSDPDPRFRGPGAVAHPGYLLRFANTILVQNVLLGPWIHVSSEVQQLGLAQLGEDLTTRGRVLGTFERKGHKFVELDVAVASGSRPVMRVHHTAIYDPRKGR